MANLVLILFAVICTSSSQILLKIGMKGFDFASSGMLGMLKQLLTPYVLIGLIIYAVSAMIWLLVLSKVELTFAYPFISLGFVIVLLAGIFILGEQLNIYRIIGVLLIVGGVILVSITNK